MKAIEYQRRLYVTTTTVVTVNPLISFQNVRTQSLTLS